MIVFLGRKSGLRCGDSRSCRGESRASSRRRSETASAFRALATPPVLPDEPPPKRTHIGSAKDPLFSVQPHAGDLLAEAGIPAFAKIFDFGQFRHASDSATPGLPLLPRD